MSTLKSSAEHLTLNADGSGNDIKFQSNATEVAAIDQAGNLTLSGTVDGVDIQALNTAVTNASNLTSGTLPDARFPSTLPALNGSALTNLPAAAIVSATAPSSPALGDLWFQSSSSSNAMKVWSGAGWDQMSNKFGASGGTESTFTDGGVLYKVHTFTSGSNFTTTGSASTTVTVVILGGGGGGGSGSGEWAFGGGGGGYLKYTINLSPGTYAVAVGAAGAGLTSCNNAATGATGGTSSFAGSSSTGGVGGGNGGGAPGGAGGTYSLASGYAALISNVVGGVGNSSTGNGSGGGGTNGGGSLYGSGAAGVANTNPGNHASGYGNGGGGGHSCQSGHRGGGNGSQGIVTLQYSTE
jgi:hypothetical protein